MCACGLLTDDGLAHECSYQGGQNENSRSWGHELGATVVRISTSRWADGNDCFEQMYLCLSLAQLVHRLANVVAVLTLLNCNHTDGRISEFIGGGKVRDTVMLIVRQLHVVLDPNNGWQRISFDMALQIHVILKGLTKARTRNSDDGCEFNFQIDVTAISFAHTIVGNAIICATIFLANGVDLQNGASVCCSA